MSERAVDELVRLQSPPPEVECEECHGDGDIILTCHCCGGRGTFPVDEEQEDSGLDEPTAPCDTCGERPDDIYGCRCEAPGADKEEAR